MKLLRLVAILVLEFALIACGGSEPGVQKVAEGEGYLLLDPEGKKHRIPVKSMEIYLVDPSYVDRYPERFEITGPDLHLVGSFPMSVHVGYGEHFDKMKFRTVDVAASGNPSGHEDVNSHITLPGQLRSAVLDGTLEVTKVLDNTLYGNITLELDGGQTHSGIFLFHAMTWG